MKNPPKVQGIVERAFARQITWTFLLKYTLVAWMISRFGTGGSEIMLRIDLKSIVIQDNQNELEYERSRG